VEPRDQDRPPDTDPHDQDVSGRGGRFNAAPSAPFAPGSTIALGLSVLKSTVPALLDASLSQGNLLSIIRDEERVFTS
jgi:hypothetical protein